jgi:hypothetical protein
MTKQKIARQIEQRREARIIRQEQIEKKYAPKKQPRKQPKKHTRNLPHYENRVYGKKCTGPCDAFHPMEMYGFYDKDHTNQMAECKPCVSERRKKRRGVTRILEQNRRYTYGPTKICKGKLCLKINKKGVKLPIKMFGLRSKVTGQREAKCINCLKCNPGRTKKRIHEKNQKYYHKKGGKEKAKKYQEEYKPRRNARNKERRKTDPNYRIKCIVRHRIYECLKKSDIYRDKKIKYLGMTLRLYRKWMEYQFDEYMTWDNHGTYWHIDHVRPCDSFKFKNNDDKEIYKCFNWSNTRHMRIDENLEKSCAIIPKEIGHQIFVSGIFMLNHIEDFGKEIWRDNE